jgi:glutathione S-transferase
VRRIAISLQLLGIPFEHRSLSVFSTFDQFKQLNPVVKAPTLVCDDGTVLMDSTLILDYAEALAAPGKSLMPAALPVRQRALRLLGLTLAACEKSVQIVYEHEVRPPEKLYAPWLERVQGQALAAFGELERELQRQPLSTAPIDQAGVTAAVVWSFSQLMVPEVVRAADFPTLAAFAAAAEALPAFVALPQV